MIGVVVASTLVGDTFAPNAESVRAFHEVVVICAVLVAAGGVAGALGIVNPRRTVEAEGCPGGQLSACPSPRSTSSEPPGVTFRVLTRSRRAAPRTGRTRR